MTDHNTQVQPADLTSPFALLGQALESIALQSNTHNPDRKYVNFAEVIAQLDLSRTPEVTLRSYLVANKQARKLGAKYYVKWADVDAAIEHIGVIDDE